MPNGPSWSGRGRGFPTPRWASYYLDVPAWALDESRLDELEDSDLVIVRAGMAPDYLPAGALDDPLASAGDFRVVTAASLSGMSPPVTGRARPGP